VTVDELAKAYGCLSPTSGFAKVALDLVQLEIADPKSIGFEEDPGDYCGQSGWVRFRSQWSLTATLKRGHDHGRAIAAEWWDGSSSHRISPHPSIAGHSLIATCSEGSGKVMLRQKVQLLPREGEEPLLYGIYWTIGDDGLLARAFHGFCGFGERK